MFEMGFAGERWSVSLNCLEVPLPGSRRAILVAKKNGSYDVIASGLLPGGLNVQRVEHLIMAVALIYQVFENYKPNSSGNLER